MSIMEYARSSGRTYQVSDLQRGYRGIVDDARRSGARIRDTDGTTLTLTSAAAFDHLLAVSALARDLIQLQHVLGEDREDRHVTSFGGFAWAATLDEDSLKEMLHEFSDALLTATTTESMDAVGELLYSWRATAEIMADAELTAELTGDLDEPLHDVEL